MAGECDFVYPWYFDATYVCDQTNTEGTCSLTQPVTFSLRPWFTDRPASCATVEWSFGDGSPVVVSNGAVPVVHTYAAAGVYTVRSVARTAAVSFAETDTFIVTVANGRLRWQSRQVTEGGVAEFQVTRTNTAGPTQLNWAITGPGGVTPTDVSPTSGTVVLPDGVAVGTFQVTSLNDNAFMGDRTYTVRGTSATAGFLPPADPVSLSITDDDFPLLQFSAPEYRTVEQNGIVTITVVRTGDPNVHVTTLYGASGTTGVVGTSGMLVFAPGVTSRTFNVVTTDDAVWTGERTTFVELSWPGGGARFPNGNFSHFARLVVTENDPPASFRVSDVRVVEGDAGTTRGSFIVETSEPVFASLNYVIAAGTAKAGSDYRVSLPSGSVSFSPSVRRATISFDVVGDTEAETDEFLQLTLRFPSPSNLRLPGPATATVVNDDAGLAPREVSIPRGGTAVAVLNVGAPVTEPVVVALQSTHPSIVSVPASVTIAPGSNGVEIVMQGLAPGGANVEVKLPASHGGKLFTVGVRVFDSAQLTFEPSSVNIVAGQRVPVRVKLDRVPEQPLFLPITVLNAKVAKAPREVLIGNDGAGTFNVEGVGAGFTVVRATLPDEYGNEVAGLDVHVSSAGNSPSLTSIAPVNGPSAGGTPFTATGSKLGAACTLLFGGVPATGLKAAADGSLAGVTPAHAPGTVNVTLSCGASQFVLQNAFTYLDAPPELASVTPSFGSLRGRTLVRATGANFQSGCWMFFGETPADRVEIDSPTRLTAAAPQRNDAALVSTSVRCGTHTAALPSSFAYTDAAEPSPSIVSVAPLVGGPGETITLSGLRFRVADLITFGDAPATILRTRPDEHVVRVPELPLGTVAITLTDGELRTTTTGPIFMVVEPAPPQITAIAPGTVLPGSEIVLEGRGFRPAYSFAIGGLPATVASLAYDRVTLRVPASLTPGEHALHVLNSAGRVAVVGPAVKVGTGALRLTSLSPSCGSTNGGTIVVLTGAGFADGAIVRINGVAATDVVIASDTEIRAVAPKGATGKAAVSVSNVNGDAATSTGAYEYVSPLDPHGCVQTTRSRAARH